MKGISHKNVIKLKDVFQSPSNYYLVMDYCNGGDLSTFVGFDPDEVDRAHLRLEENLARHVIKQICEGVVSIAEMGFIHRDIKL